MLGTTTPPQKSIKLRDLLNLSQPTERLRILNTGVSNFDDSFVGCCSGGQDEENIVDSQVSLGFESSFVSAAPPSSFSGKTPKHLLQRK